MCDKQIEEREADKNHYTKTKNKKRRTQTGGKKEVGLEKKERKIEPMSSNIVYCSVPLSLCVVCLSLYGAHCTHVLPDISDLLPLLHCTICPAPSHAYPLGH